MSPAEPRKNTTDLGALIARSRANIAWSRRLCRDARAVVTRSARLCPTAIVGASDGTELEALGRSPVANGHPIRGRRRGRPAGSCSCSPATR